MPTYDYVCDGCQHEFEMFQPITEDPKKKCPKCKKNKLRRLFGTGAAIVFKGSGFYTTDYRSDSYKKAAAADKTSAGGSSESKGKSSSSEGSSSSGKSGSSSKSDGGKSSSKSSD